MINHSFSPYLVKIGKNTFYHLFKSNFFSLTDEELFWFKSINNREKSLSDLKDDNVSLYKEFEKSGFLMPEQKHNFYREAQQPSKVSIYVEITEACNFNCPGCSTGVDIKKARGEELKTLSKENTFRIIKEALKSCKEKKIHYLQLKWAGGEPLLPKSFKIIQEIQQEIVGLSKKYNIEVEQIIITNGSLLSKEKASFFKENNIHLTVSLWGLGDKNQKLRNGLNNSYPAIINGIKLLVENGVKFNIHHVITPNNASKYVDFIESMWDVESDMYLGKDWSWPHNNIKSIPVYTSFYRAQNDLQLKPLIDGGYKKMADGVLTAFNKIKSMIDRGIKIQSLGGLDYLSLYELSPKTCGVGSSYIAVGSRGIAPCHEALLSSKRGLEVALEESEQNSNFIDLGIDQAFPEEKKYLFATEMKNDLDSNINESWLWNFLSLHGGTGCPRARMRENGTIRKPAAITKYLYAKIVKPWLELEAYRLMKK